MKHEEMERRMREAFMDVTYADPDKPPTVGDYQRAAVTVALAAVDEARQERDEYYGGILFMTVARLGGKVEGRPTHRGNFLQRIDALRGIEADARRAIRARMKREEANRG